MLGGGVSQSRNKATAIAILQIPYYNSWSFLLQNECTINSDSPEKPD